MTSKLRSKIFELSFAIALFCLMAACASVPAPGPDVRVYYSNPDKGGLVREQTAELLPYADSRGYLCLPPEDFKKTLEHCAKKTPARDEYPVPQ